MTSRFARVPTGNPEMHPPSVLFLNSIRQEDWGGVETWMLLTAVGLFGRGWRISACGVPAGRFLAAFEERSFPTVDHTFRRRRAPIDAWRLQRAIRRHSVDVVVTKLERGIRAVALARLLGARAPIVQRQGLFEIKERRRNRLALRLVARIITPSAAIREAIIDTGIFPPDRVDFVPNGVDAERFRPRPDERAAAREKLGVPPGPLLVSVGRQPLRVRPTCRWARPLIWYPKLFDSCFSILA